MRTTAGVPTVGLRQLRLWLRIGRQEVGVTGRRACSLVRTFGAPASPCRHGALASCVLPVLPATVHPSQSSESIVASSQAWVVRAHCPERESSAPPRCTADSDQGRAPSARRKSGAAGWAPGCHIGKASSPRKSWRPWWIAFGRSPSISPGDFFLTGQSR